jgi:hypothetical protein
VDFDGARIRRPSKGFGWVDHRIVKGGYLEAMGPGEASVYLLLCVVADRYGISFYRGGKLARLLNRPAATIEPALANLCQMGLIAISGRYVQVLDVDEIERARRPHPTAPGPAARHTPSAPAESASEPAAVILARLPAPVRDDLLDRARQRLSRFLGSQAPRAVALEALAVALWREGQSA